MSGNWDKTEKGKKWRSEYQKKYYSDWYAKNGRKRSPVQTEAVLRWRQEHPDGLLAYNILQKALYHGDIVKPKICDYCKKEKKLTGHHEDYAEPLVVIWLCYSCHKLKHVARDLTNDE